jgi:hypothetical protein
MATYSVNGSSGVMTLTNIAATGVQVLPGAQTEECEITFTMDWITGGAGTLEPAVYYRAASDLSTFFKVTFTVDLDFLTNDTITAVTLEDENGVIGTEVLAKTHTIGVPFSVKIRSTTNHFIRVWDSNVAEPSTWDAVIGSASSASGTVALAGFSQLDAAVPASLTPIAVVGFEVPTLEGAATGNSVYINTINSLTISSPGGGFDGVGRAGIYTSGSGAIGPAFITGGNQFALTWHIRFDTALPGANMTLMQCSQSGISPDTDLIFRSSDGRLVVSPGAGGTVQVGPVVVANTWYRIDVGFSGDGTNIAVHWAVDGVAQTTATVVTAGYALSTVQVGMSSAGPVATYRVDDIVLTASFANYPIGAERVISVLPTATITQVGTADALARFRANGGILDTTFNATDILVAIQSATVAPSGSCDGFYQRTSGVGNFLNIPMDTYVLQSGEGVGGVRMEAIGWAATSTTNNFSVLGNTGGSNETVFALADPGFDATTSPPWLCVIYNTAGGWDQAKLNALAYIMGGANDISPVPGINYLQSEVIIRSGDAGITSIDLYFDDFQVCALEAGT